MGNEMYFMGLIAEAFGEADIDAALQAALEKIIAHSSKPEYARGYEQFEVFMSLVNSHIKKNSHNALSENIIRALMVELATDSFDGDPQQKQNILEIIKSKPEWQKDYQALVGEISRLQKPFENVDIMVLRDEQPIGTVSLTEQDNTRVIDKLIPGAYKIMLSTGRLLWEGLLADNDLLWSRAFAGEPFKMAADSGGIKGKAAKTITLLEGEILLNVFAGVETGSLEIKMNF